MKHAILVASVLAACCIDARAGIPCAAASNTGDPSYTQALRAVVSESGIGSRWIPDHEWVIRGFCARNQSMIDRVVRLKLINERDVAAIERTLTRELEPPKPSARIDPQIDAAIDAAFIEWSESTWIIDRYVVASAQTTEKVVKGDNYVARGMFKFTRGDVVNAIPFAASLKRAGDRLNVVNLCYNDTTYGSTDCLNAGSAQTRAVMALIIAAGLSGVFNETDEEYATREKGMDAARAQTNELNRKIQQNRTDAAFGEKPTYPEVAL